MSAWHMLGQKFRFCIYFELLLSSRNGKGAFSGSPHMLCEAVDLQFPSSLFFNFSMPGSKKEKHKKKFENSVPVNAFRIPFGNVESLR